MVGQGEKLDLKWQDFAIENNICIENRDFQVINIETDDPNKFQQLLYALQQWPLNYDDEYELSSDFAEWMTLLIVFWLCISN